jgi:hypothetical protein
LPLGWLAAAEEPCIALELAVQHMESNQMKLNPRRLVSIGGLSVLMALPLGVLPTLASAQPKLTIQSEEAAHPRMVAAIHHMQEGLREMEAAPDDFGGNKAQAIRDCKVAIHSLRRALYFRLHMDDAAIDRIP